MSLVLKQPGDKCPTCGRALHKNGFDKQRRQMYRCDYCVRSHGSARHVHPIPRLTMTAQRKKILGLAAQGLTHHEIGAIVCVTPNTVKNTLSEIHRILDSRNTAHAIYIALKQGLIE